MWFADFDVTLVLSCGAAFGAYQPLERLPVMSTSRLPSWHHPSDWIGAGHSVWRA